MEIHKRLKGKKIEAVFVDGKNNLVIRLMTGEEIVIGWGDRGPEFIRQDVRIFVPGVSVFSKL